MRAIGKHIVIKETKENSTITQGGLVLAEKHREDIRYTKASVVSIGDEVEGLKQSDTIFFDRHAGHKIEIGDLTYHVIKLQDVVVVL